MSLKQQTFTAVRWTSLAMVGKSALQFVQVAILARLLMPADFGLMAMVLAVMVFVQVFTDMGVSNAIIHHQNISKNQLSSLYWLNVTVAAILMLLLMASSELIGTLLFQQPGLQPVLTALSVSIFLTALGQQLRVVAEKNLRFAVLAKIEITAALAGFVCAITWAWMAPSANALVAGMLVNSAVQTALLWLFTANGWRPAFRLQLGEIQQFLKFGGYMIANNFVNSINLQIDVLIAGRFFPAAALGAYSLPRNLSLTIAGVINPVITRIGFPLMAKAQGDKEFLKLVYLKTMRMTASVNFPIYIGMAVFSKESIFFLFGERWSGSAPLLVFLSLWGMFRSCGNPVGSLLLAVGKADLSLKWNLGLLFIVPPVLWGASNWGIYGLAIAQALLMSTLMWPAWYFLVRPQCNAGAVEYAKTMLGPLFAAGLAVGIAYLAVTGLNSPLWRLIVGCLVAVPAYLLISLVFNRQWLLAMRQLIIKR